MAVLNSRAWMYRFPAEILGRGEDYYENGQIINIQKTDRGWKAEAEGTHRYSVEVVTDGENVKDMHCSCPYAEDHPVCKHMAGLLFALSEEETDAIEPENTETLEEVIGRMSNAELKNELTRIADREPGIAAGLRNRYGSRMPDRNTAEQIFVMLDSLAYEHGDRYGFIDWRAGEDYVSAFNRILADTVQPLIDRGAYDTAFLALDKAFFVLNNVEMDGSSGEHSDIATEIAGYWNQIIHRVTPEERDKLHDWFENMEKESSDLICGDVITDTLEKSFDDPKYIDPLLDDVRRKLDDPDLSEWETGKLLEKLNDLLKRSGRDGTEFEAWLNAHKDSITVKKIRLDQAEKRNDFPAQIRILEDLLECDEVRWERTGYRKKLLEVYQKTDDTDNEKETLRRLLFEDGSEDLMYLRRLRELTDPKRWGKVREFYLSAHCRFKPEIYAEEGQYRKLMDALGEEDIKVIDQYRDLLKDRYPKELLGLYVIHLESLTQEHPSSRVYSDMERYLQSASAIRGSIMPLMRLIRSWRQEYPTRVKMQEMLDKTEKKLMEM